MWQQIDDDTLRSKDEAASHCNDKILGNANYSDWRLPTIYELISIVDYSKKNPAIDPIFIGTDNQYWSSTISSQSWGWFVYFSAGVTRDSTYPYNKNYAVRCVRNNSELGLWSQDFYVINDVVVDYSTGLTWQHQTDGIKRKWESALNYCEGLLLGGFADWRLPNIKELHTIVFYSTGGPKINTEIFIGSNDGLWSSTTITDVCTSEISNDLCAFYIDFKYDGDIKYELKEYVELDIRCVRGGK
jgi:hypothetical protein